jgi:microcystin-dependent protein
MAGTSNFQQFNPSQNNQLTDADYALSTYRLNGATAGVAPSIDHNKLYYQLSTFVAAMAQAFANHGYAVSDASLSTLTSVLDNIVLGLNPNISSICLGSQIYLSIVGTDLWITGNAYYDGSNWQRVDTALASFAFNISSTVNIPGQTTSTKGMAFWRAIAGSNPISATYNSAGGWELVYLLNGDKSLTAGGSSITLNGTGNGTTATTPYGRFLHTSTSNTSPKHTGILTNLHDDLSSLDDNTQPSWFIGRQDDSFVIQRAAAGSSTLTTLFSIDNTGTSSAIPAGTKLETYCSTAPAGYLVCDGSAVSRTTYLALFNAIGVAYGAGDGTTTFNLPDERDRVSVGKGLTFNVMGATGGEINHQLVTSEMPSHVHSITPPNCASESNSGYTVSGNDSIGTEPIFPYNSASTGGDGAHNNLQPYIVTLHCIKY